MAGAQAQPKWTFSIFMIVLATSLPFVVTGVDPLLLSLNLPAIRQDLGIPSDLVDPEEELIGILMTQHVWDSPGAPGVLLPLTFEKASSIGLQSGEYGGGRAVDSPVLRSAPWPSRSYELALQEQYALVGEQWINQVQYLTQSTLLSISIVSIGLALWSISSGFRSLTKALNVIHEVKESRPGWKRYPLSVFYAGSLPIMIILALGLLLIGPELVAWIVGLVGLDEVFISLWTWLRLPVALVLLMLVVSIIYWVIPNVNHRYRLITPGGAIAVISWVIASLGFSFYLANFANYSVIYGSLGAAFALLLYFYISAAVLLLGAEVNVAIHHCSSYGRIQREERVNDHETPDAKDGSRKDV